VGRRGQRPVPEGICLRPVPEIAGAPISSVPFRWDLVSPDQLGSLPSGTAELSLWFLDTLAEYVGKVLARIGNGDIFFVSRPLDSMFDLLSGALTGSASAPQPGRLPLSFQRPWEPRAAGGVGARSPAQRSRETGSCSPRRGLVASDDRQRVPQPERNRS
jgi:hypothetical protein